MDTTLTDEPSAPGKAAMTGKQRKLPVSHHPMSTKSETITPETEKPETPKQRKPG
jgi:hypothetical protein